MYTLLPVVSHRKVWTRKYGKEEEENGGSCGWEGPPVVERYLMTDREEVVMIDKEIKEGVDWGEGAEQKVERQKELEKEEEEDISTGWGRIELDL